MATVDIDGTDYNVYADVDYADAYLAGDVQRAAAWAALVTAGDKERALVSATRLLQRQQWKDGVPSTDDPVLEVIADATSLLAADIAAKPTLGDSGSTSSNVKAVGAGSAKVEFFAPVVGNVLPSAAFALLAELLGYTSSDDVGLDNTAYGSYCRRSRFPPDECTDRYTGGYYGAEEVW